MLPHLAGAGVLCEGLVAYSTQLRTILSATAAAAQSGPLVRQLASAAAQPSLAEAAEQFAAQAKKVSVSINGRNIAVPEGTSVLQAANQLGIYIPTLCTHPRLPTTPGTCRLCLVEEAGRLRPACATPVTEGMAVETDTPAVKHNVHSMLQLLKANHPLACMTCDVSGRCEFQDLIRRYNISDALPAVRHSQHEWDSEVQADYEEVHGGHGGHEHHPAGAIEIDLDKCLKCGRCVTACGLVQDMNVLGWVGRGSHRHPGVMADALESSKCIECGQCASVCPVGAISERSEWRQVADLLEARRKTTVAMVAPAVRVAIGEEVGLAPGSITVGQLVTALRQLGFDHVLDVDFAADLTIMEEGTELLGRLKHAWGLDSTDAPSKNAAPHPQTLGNTPVSASASGSHSADAPSRHQQGGHSSPGPLPMFTSCCPAWINMAESSYPELLPHISSCKSPQGMMGAVVKKYYAGKLGLGQEDVSLVSVMPCTAKKHEAERPEVSRPGEPGPDVDFVLTTRELGHMLRSKRVPLASLPEGRFDDPLGQSTGAAVIFGATGGVMEAALRTAYEIAAGQPLPKVDIHEVRGLKGIKEATVKLPDSAPAGVAGREIRVAVASGIGNARHLLQSMQQGSAPAYDFIEVMACPGGCIGGGGQPKTKDPSAVLKRMGAVYTLDQRSALRKSHENPAVQALYGEFLGQPGGERAHELLHTQYHDRSRTTVPPYTVLEREAAPGMPPAGNQADVDHKQQQ